MYIAIILDHYPNVAHDEDDNLETLKLKLVNFKDVGCIYNTESLEFESVNPSHQNKLPFMQRRLEVIIANLGL